MTTTTSLVDLPRTILGSLTTIFTAPTSCAYLGVGYVGDDLVGWEGQKCGGGGGDGLVDDQACWPGTTAGAAYPNTPFSGWGFYSPGLACPAGYSSACTATASGSADWPVQFSLEAGETAVGCCPSGYACTNRVTESGQSCYLLASSTTLTTASCSGDVLTGGIMTLPYSSAATATGSAATTSTMRAWAPMVQINWKASDRSAGAAVSDGTSAVGTSTSAAVASSATTSSSTSSSSSISIGAIVGAVVGAVAGVLLVAAASFFLWRHRRAQRGAGGADGTAAAKWQGGGGGQYANASELPDPADAAVWRNHREMAAVGNFAELPADQPARPVEAPGQSGFVEAPT